MKVLIILGDKHYLNGPILKNRLKRSLLLSTNQNLNYIIVTGGNTTGKPGHSEAYIMKQWLVKNGVPKNKILLENRSMNTIENAKFTKRMVDKMHNVKLIMVTSKNHMPRARKIFNNIYQKKIRFFSS